MDSFASILVMSLPVIVFIWLIVVRVLELRSVLLFSSQNYLLMHDANSRLFSPRNNVVFFSPDIHDGTRRDLALSLYNLNQSIILSSKKCDLPKYSIVHSMRRTDSELTKPVFPSMFITNETMCSKIICRSYNNMQAERVFNIMKDYSKISFVDAFICAFYPAECLNYVTTNKTVVFLPAHRFLLKLCNPYQIPTALYWMFHSGLPNIRVIAMGRYDKEYINYFTGMDVPFLYPSSLYEYTPPMRRTVFFDEILVAPFKGRWARDYAAQLNDIALQKGINVTFMTTGQKLRRPFTYDDLNRFKAVVVFPYAVLSYYLCDITTAGIPMVLPSRTYLSTHTVLVDYRNQDYPYCNGRAQMPDKHPDSRHPFSPEDNSTEARYYWTQFAYFFTPCTTTFDSLEDIPRIVQNMNYEELYRCNLQYNEVMKVHNRRVWSSLIDSIDHRQMANEFDAVLKTVNRTAVYDTP